MFFGQTGKLHSAATKDIPLWHARRVRRPGSPQICLLARAAALPTYINDSGRADRRGTTRGQASSKHTQSVAAEHITLRVRRVGGNIPVYPRSPYPLHKVGPEIIISTPVPP